jgi:cytochrome c-type biogenesis protein CcmH
VRLQAWLLGLLLAFAAGDAVAQAGPPPTPIEFRDAAEEARFRALSAQLRCVMCQNQSLADSDAPIAHDLRQQVLALMREGRSDAQIKDYLVERYSEFVLYSPPVKPSTWGLWFGPLLVLLAGVAVIVVIVRRRARALPASPADVAGSQTEEDQEW